MVKEIVSACVGFIFAIAGIVISNLFTRLGPTYWVGLALLFISVNIFIVLYGEVVILWIQKRRILTTRVALGVLVASIILPPVCTCIDGYNRQKTTAEAMTSFLDRLAEHADMRSCFLEQISDSFPQEAWYDTPMSWDPSYFSKGWRNGERFEVTCVRTRYSEDEVIHAIPRQGTSAYLIDADDIATVRVKLHLQSEHWQPIFYVNLVKSESRWRMWNTHDMNQIVSVIVTDMESTRLHKLYVDFLHAYAKGNQQQLGRLIYPDTDLAIAHRLLAGKHVDGGYDHRRSFSANSLPPASKVRCAMWSQGRGLYWLAADPKYGYALRTSICDEGEGLFFFRKSRGSDTWQIEVR